MSKDEIISLLTQNHDSFINTIKNVSEEEFVQFTDEKWSVGQQLEHINKSVRPIYCVIKWPKFIPSFLFGKTKRACKSYNTVVESYR